MGGEGRERAYKSDGGDEGVSGAEGVEYGGLPLSGVVDVVPPTPPIQIHLHLFQHYSPLLSSPHNRTTK